MSRTTLIISPAPTANGDLHLGHIAGPFLASDVHARYLRSTGRDALLATGFQDTSTYVVTTAHRLGIPPERLVAQSGEQISSTLTSVGVDVDGYTGDEDRFVTTVLEFMGRLHAAGKFELRTMTFPYSPATGEYLVDGFAKGGCPLCLTEGCAGLCESCGHPISAGDLIDPKSTLDPEEPVELREASVLVLPLERYRERIREHFAEFGSAMRPHMAQTIGQMLSRPLPDYPVTYPTSWGIPAPFPEVPGQRINPNAEPAAWSLYCGLLASERGGTQAADDGLLLTGADTKVVYFLGFDNTYPFAIAALAMLLATDGRYLLPEEFVTNEFYELDNAKFSTSRGHVVWGHDLVAEVPRDLVRFHLAATSPENQRTDFSRSALARVTSSRLVAPWNRIADKVDRLIGSGPLPVSERSRAAAARIAERFAACYELEYFSLTRAADTLTDQLSRLALWPVKPGQEGDYCHEVDTVLRCAAPLLIDLAEKALPDTRIGAGGETMSVVPRVLPRLTGWAG
ncbi:class I tRNA ligase family protein [Nocardiopsis sp. MG754419]|uniref:class I tRNA ligase family protein n=1 Tax=Nocardiopsis sp. MG754419 TaxID=2259865 RepID=UPI001BA83A84|nr:class I tRNA ligase family protein [Nocardiopsis sp. MG754419]MBR8741645.1 methionine--tRNA ligase [Nocardiopsis sp. MG754419]